MRLSELNPFFVRHDSEGSSFRRVDTMAEAHGVMFLCPKCFKANGGPRGTHSMICWSKERGTPDHATPAPGRWRLDGTSLADLTLNAEPPSTARSVQINGGCEWHGFITNGEIVGGI